MYRSELYALDTYKNEEMKVRLKPVTDWNKVSLEEEIWHCDSNSIYGYDTFEGLTEEGYVRYQNYKGEYTRSNTGWYYYDESIAVEVDELWTPKLWEVCDRGYQEDRWLFVACNEQHLLSCWNEEQRDNLTYGEFVKQYDLCHIEEVDGFKIMVK